MPPPAYLAMVDKSMTMYSVSWRKCYGEAIINNGWDGHLIEEIRSNDQPERRMVVNLLEGGVRKNYVQVSVQRNGAKR